MSRLASNDDRSAVEGFRVRPRRKQKLAGDLVAFLRRLFAINLKRESFQLAHTGQMEHYLWWLDKHKFFPATKP